MPKALGSSLSRLFRPARNAVSCRLPSLVVLNSGCLNVFPSATAFSSSSHLRTLAYYWCTSCPNFLLWRLQTIVPSRLTSHLRCTVHVPLALALLFFCQVCLPIGHLSEQYRRPSLEMANHFARAAGMKLTNPAGRAESGLWQALPGVIYISPARCGPMALGSSVSTTSVLLSPSHAPQPTAVNWSQADLSPCTSNNHTQAPTILQ
jgi:hypothetical protein